MLSMSDGRQGLLAMTDELDIDAIRQRERGNLGAAFGIDVQLHETPAKAGRRALALRRSAARPMVVIWLSPSHDSRMVLKRYLTVPRLRSSSASFALMLTTTSEPPV